MRRGLLFVIVVILLIAGGLITLSISKQGGAAVPGLRVQTDNPEASVLAVTPDKGFYFFVFTAVALGGVVGTAVILAVIFWLLNRTIAIDRKKPNEGFDFTLDASKPNTVGGLVTRHPSVTIAIVVLLLAVAAVGAAVMGVFTSK